GRAQERLEPRLAPADLGDVGQEQLVDEIAVLAHETEVGEEVFLARERGERRAAAPEQPLPRQRNLHGGQVSLKLTFGTCLASAGAWKNGYSLNPNNFAVRLAGNWRRPVSYSCTRSL